MGRSEVRGVVLPEGGVVLGRIVGGVAGGVGGPLEFEVVPGLPGFVENRQTPFAFKDQYLMTDPFLLRFKNMETFARIIAEDVLIFAYCNEGQMDEDFAVAQLERIAGQLRSLGPDTIVQFIQTVRFMEEEARQQDANERSEQLASMPRHLGLEA